MDESEFLISRLKGLYGKWLESIVIFGSRTRKRYNEDSDLDVLVVLNNKKGKDISKIRKEFLLNFGHRLDIQIIDKFELISNFKSFSPLFCTLVLGIGIIYDLDGFFKKSFGSFIKDISKEQIKYCERGEIWDLKKRSLEILH